RVIADHIRTLSFSIADSIIPGNTGRNYVLRRILRRAVKYGRTLGFNGNEPFLPRLVDTLVEEFSHVFPEIKTRAAVIKETLTLEEESFNKTLDRGMEKFEKAAGENVFPPEDAFQLYDTFGFPLDLTALLCRERGITLDEKAVEARMEEARKLSRASQKKMVVRATEISTDVITEFLGFEKNSCEAIVLEIHGNLVITDKTVFFTEMGGQEGDTGTLNDSTITSTQQIGSAIAHQIEGNIPAVGDTVDLTINRERRSPIEAHHTATHLLHWAIHKVISPDASQQGSSVSPDRLTFDFNSKAVTPEQIEAIEERVNSAIKADDTVSWVEVPHSTVKDREDIMQFFGDKYGDLVRVVQIGGGDKTLDGYSMELCGGTHVRKTSDIGIFKIKSEGSTGAGIRRIEAVCGPAAEAFLGEQQEKESAEKSEALAKLAKANESLAKLDAPTLLVPDNALAFEVKNQAIEAEKALKKAQATGAARMADSLIAEKNITGNIVISTEGSPALLQELLNGLKKIQFTQAAFIVIDDGSKLHLGAICGNEGKENGHGAGNLIQNLGPIAGGKGGGKPDMARGAASEREKLDPLVAAANQELGLQTRPEPKSKNTP
ncbi:alanine--tRNA ligase-related protein, partial [Akkermansiaceae bacterium]|nr:alanine--tRNA ligase-related protein [Akkermansiaceae bacterium]